MKRFLDRLAAQLSQSSVPLYRQHVVLPNRRAALFMKKAFKKRADTNLISPEISSIEGFMTDLSGLSPLSKADLLLAFYSVVAERDRAVGFESFLQWAPQTLRDFNDLDLHLIPPDRFFEHLEAERKLEHWTLAGEAPTAMVRKYLSFWRDMGHGYKALREKLCTEGLAYRGLRFRRAAQAVEAYRPKGPLVFAGLNALTPAEEAVVFHLLETGQAKAFWDADAHLLAPEQEAGASLRRYRKRLTQRGLPFEWVSDTLRRAKEVKVHACPKTLAQAHTLGEILSEWSAQSTDLSDCAAVLASERLLPAVLQKIPEGIEKLNLSIGFPLAKTQWSKLFSALLEICCSPAEKGGQEPAVELKKLMEITENPIAVKLLEGGGRRTAIADFLQRAKEENPLHLKSDALGEAFAGSALGVFFQSEARAPESLLLHYLELIETAQRYALSQTTLEEAAALQLGTVLEKTRAYLQTHDFLKRPSCFEKFFAQLLQEERIDCSGDPWEGLQITGVLETRCLDFSKLVLLSANEGVLPAELQYDSYIPFGIRRHFKMSTYRDREAVYAHHFYHLLQRCEEAHLLYSSETTDLNAGEKSRFIRQYQEEIGSARGELQHPPARLYKNRKRLIEKSERILERLREKARSGISASFLNAYLRNPIDFYYEKMLDIPIAPQNSEYIPAHTLGDIAHDTLERLYRPYTGKALCAAHFDALLQEAEGVYAQAFQRAFSPTAHQSGYEKLVYEVFKELLRKQLGRDQKQASRLRFISFEREIDSGLSLDGKLSVRLRGKIDRIDEMDGVPRIIDYKTGRPEAGLHFDPAWDLETFRKKKQAGKLLQLMLYTQLFFEAFQGAQHVRAGVLYLSSGAEDNCAALELGGETRLTPDCLKSFQSLLAALLEELFNPDIPFVEGGNRSY